MNAPLAYAASAGNYRAQVVDKVVTGLTAGASVVIRGVGGTGDILPAVAAALAEAGQRVLEVRPPLDGAAFIGQLAAGWRCSVGGPAVPPATSAETFVLLVHGAEQMPAETVRHLERLAQAWPGMRIALGGAPSTASAISAGLYPTLTHRLSVTVQLAAAADLGSPLDRDYDWATVSATGLPAGALMPRPAVLAASKPRRRLNPVGATAAGGFLAALALTVAIGPRLVGAQSVRATALPLPAAPPGPQAPPQAMAEARVAPAPAAALAVPDAPVPKGELETPVTLDAAFTAGLGQQVALAAATQAVPAPVADPAPIAAEQPLLNPAELAVASPEPAAEASPAAEAPASPGPAVTASAGPIEPTPELPALDAAQATTPPVEVVQATTPPVKTAEETAPPVETAEATARPAAESASPTPAVEPDAAPPHGLAAEAALPGQAGPAIRAPILAIAAQAIQPRTPPALAEGMARRGRAMLEWGDVSGARLLLERAADAGSGPAALALGTTYDSATLERIGAVGIQPDPDQAAYWFRLALGLGEERARPLLDALPRRDAAARTTP